MTSPSRSWIDLTWDLESSDGGERLTSSCHLCVEVNNSVVKRARSSGAYAALHIATGPPIRDENCLLSTNQVIITCLMSEVDSPEERECFT